MLKILKSPNQILTKMSDFLVLNSDNPSEVKVLTPEGEMTLPVFVSVLVATMYSNPACGLAAPQLGVSKRIIVYNPDEENNADNKDTDKTGIMINPEIKTFSEKTEKEIETCLSLPGVEGNIKRHIEIQVKYLDEDLKPLMKIAKGWEAKIIQHEVDHLNGVLFWDRLGVMKTSHMNKYRIAQRRKKGGK